MASYELLPAGRGGRYRYGFRDPESGKLALVSQGGWNDQVEAAEQAIRIQKAIALSANSDLEAELKSARYEKARLQTAYDDARHALGTARLTRTTAVVIAIGLAVALVWSLTGSPIPDLHF